MTTRVPVRPVEAYQPRAGAFDEMVDGRGQVREHWSQVAVVLDGLGSDGLTRRQLEADHLLDLDGATYTVVGPAGSHTRRWSLDPVPVPLTSEEWAAVERGVTERAELLDLVLGDLYGERLLLRRGVLPAEVILAHPGFERACVGIRLPGEHHLFTLAVDLARGPDGAFVAIADRAEAPSGAGYALVNRIAVSHVFPSLYRDADVHRVAPFFRTLRTGLQRVAPAGIDDPRIVVLTPGPASETAFEHAFLATYLGYPLVQGSDLVVRDGRLWLRSLTGLEPVHVVLRRVDAWFCDPLELRPDSLLGVPGLIEACRNGAVSVVNPLGSGVLENAGLLPFLPAAAQALLGRPLSLATLDTWWCGEPSARSHVLANLDRLVLKPIARGSGPLAIFGWELSHQQLDDLRRRIVARPHLWVGQSPAHPSTAPTLLDDGTLAPRPIVLRAFAVAAAASYAVLPGGLSRVAGEEAGTRVSGQAGARSKDTWVLASEPELLTGFWLSDSAAAASTAATPMSPRAAENLFWLGRYAERADAFTRLLRVTLDRRTDFQHGLNPAGTDCLHALLEAVTVTSATYPGFVGPGSAEAARRASPGDELASLVGDRARAGTLAFAVDRLVTAATEVRDQLSLDTWLVVGSIEAAVAEVAPTGADRQATAQRMLREVMHGILALHGLTAESMVRDPGWHLLDAGVRIERATQLASLLAATVTTTRSTAVDSLLYESVLTAAESIVTYRRRYRSQAHVVTLLDLLLHDRENPRSMAFQLDRLAADLAALPMRREGGRRTTAERKVLEASTALELWDTAALAMVDGQGNRRALVDALAALLDHLAAVSDAVRNEHFAPTLPPRTLAAGTRGGRPPGPGA